MKKNITNKFPLNCLSICRSSAVQLMMSNSTTVCEKDVMCSAGKYCRIIKKIAYKVVLNVHNKHLLRQINEWNRDLEWAHSLYSNSKRPWACNTSLQRYTLTLMMRYTLHTTTLAFLLEVCTLRVFFGVRCVDTILVLV